MVLAGQSAAPHSAGKPSCCCICHSYAPELNPIENVWAYLRSNYLCHRAYKADYEAIVDACCDAGNALMGMPDVIRSITNRAYAQVKT